MAAPGTALSNDSAAPLAASSASVEGAVFIDALNLAYWCGNPPSLRLPLTALAALLERGIETRLYFDASARHRLQHEAEIFDRLLLHRGICVVVPSGRTADGELLRQARKAGACVLSRDRYRDYRSRYRKLIDDPARLFGGHVHADRLYVPALAVEMELPVTTQAAWAAVEAQPGFKSG